MTRRQSGRWLRRWRAGIFLLMHQTVTAGLISRPAPIRVLWHCLWSRLSGCSATCAAGMVAVWCHFRPGLPAGALLHCQGVWCQTSHPVALRSALPAVCSHSDVCLFCVWHFTGPGHGVVGRLRVAAFYKRRKTELAGTALCAVPTGRTGLSVGADLYHCCLHRGAFSRWAAVASSCCAVLCWQRCCWPCR